MYNTFEEFYKDIKKGNILVTLHILSVFIVFICLLFFRVNLLFFLGTFYIAISLIIRVGVPLILFAEDLSDGKERILSYYNYDVLSQVIFVGYVSEDKAKEMYYFKPIEVRGMFSVGRYEFEQHTTKENYEKFLSNRNKFNVILGSDKFKNSSDEMKDQIVARLYLENVKLLKQTFIKKVKIDTTKLDILELDNGENYLNILEQHSETYPKSNNENKLTLTNVEVTVQDLEYLILHPENMLEHLVLLYINQLLHTKQDDNIDVGIDLVSHYEEHNIEDLNTTKFYSLEDFKEFFYGEY